MVKLVESLCETYWEFGVYSFRRCLFNDAVNSLEYIYIYPRMEVYLVNNELEKMWK
jgi:hypothetical protein